MLEKVGGILPYLNTIVIILIAYNLYRDKRPTSKKRVTIVDSCVLIDGRIWDMVEGDILADDLVIPHFVLRELQVLADGKDAYKRSRARFGLDIASRLQNKFPDKVIVDSSIKENDKTDEQLIVLAKKLSAQLMTTDYNLGKVAAVEGVKVINLNELSLALKTNVLPGEEKTLKIIQVGDSPSQGIGYLEDGVMVVVYGGAKLVGTIQIVVIERSLQTASGKMCFAHLKSADASAKRTVVKKR